MVGGNDGWILSAVAGISAVGLLGLAWSYRRPPGAQRQRGAVAGIPRDDREFRPALVADGEVANLQSDACGHRCGMAIPANRWNLGLTVLTWFAWTLGMLTIRARTGRTG